MEYIGILCNSNMTFGCVRRVHLNLWAMFDWEMFFSAFLGVADFCTKPHQQSWGQPLFFQLRSPGSVNLMGWELQEPQAVRVEAEPKSSTFAAKNTWNHTGSAAKLQTDWTLSGWWFGTWLLFFHILGIIIPTDFHIFQRGWNHQPVLIEHDL